MCNDEITRSFAIGLFAVVIAVASALAGYFYTVSQGVRNAEIIIAEEIKKEEAEKETMVNFLNESRNDPDYRYVVDGVELQDIDENTIENCDMYRIVIDEETKTVIFTTRGFGN